MEDPLLCYDYFWYKGGGATAPEFCELTYMMSFALKCLWNEFFLFFLRKSIKKFGRLPFTVSQHCYLVSELQSFEDAKIKAKSTDAKHGIFVTSQALNKGLLNF